MASITQFQYEQMMARLESNKRRAPYETTQGTPAHEPEPVESDLHEKILSDCARRGWLVVRSRMDMPSTNGVGVPDLLIFMDGGRCLLIECKSRTGKLRPEQLAWLAWAKRLGHRCAVVRSLAEFLQLADAP
jgi:hypothetical protein